MIKRILLTISVLFYAISLFAQTYVRDAEQGSANAQYRLGRMYERADRMPKDISKAVYWYKKAAEQNHPQAIMALGELYYYGVEVKQNMHLAFKYFNEAAVYNNYEACYCLGEMYEQGVGVAKHLPTAYKWYKKAADEGGLAKAQFKVGRMLYFGDGVKQDIAQGINYIKLAFNNGYPTAMEFWNENQLWRYEQ